MKHSLALWTKPKRIFLVVPTCDVFCIDDILSIILVWRDLDIIMSESLYLLLLSS